MKKIVPLVLIVAFSSCVSSTQITSSWHMPGKHIVIADLNKVLVVAMFKNEISTHLAEDQMASYLGDKGVVSYKYLNSRFPKNNADAIRDKVRDDGFDGVITMRLIDAQKEKVYNPSNFDLYPSYYSNFGGYYYRNFPYYSTQGYYSDTKIFTVETNVFSVKEDKIVWTGITKTTNPDGVEKMMQETAHVVYKRMLKEGFVTKK